MSLVVEPLSFRQELKRKYDNVFLQQVETVKSVGRLHDRLVPDNVSNQQQQLEDRSELPHQKLRLVLDLDHTLLHSNVYSSGEEQKLLMDSSSQDKMDVFKLKSMNMVTKLRPFVWTFLKELSSLYDMYIYTMGTRSYALKMAHILDPDNVFFDSGNKVFSREDCRIAYRKTLDVVSDANPNSTVIHDDTEKVWCSDKGNLIVAERYNYFASSKSFSESKLDETETGGALAMILNLLKLVHHTYFSNIVSVISLDVRQVLKTVRQEVLKDCHLVFSKVWIPEERPENQKLWNMALELGASCYINLGPSITHVICNDNGTDMAKWAVQNNKFNVSPQWIEAGSHYFVRQPEEKFPPQGSSSIF